MSGTTPPNKQGGGGGNRNPKGGNRNANKPQQQQQPPPQQQQQQQQQQRAQPQSQQPQSPSVPKVTTSKREALEIIRPQGNPQPQPPGKVQPPPQQPPQQPPQPPQHQQVDEVEEPTLTVSQPKREPVALKISPEAQQQMQLRKQTHTYTIDQLKAKKHDRELAVPAVFQFYAELQLFKRFMSNSHKNQRAGQLKSSDMPVLQHKINSILLHFNVNTFQTVFNEILALGTNSDVFVLSYVNVIFKQAVLNQPLALLFSMLSVNISYVLKHTKYADRMRELFLERCLESFVLPKEDTDKGTLILLRGIVSFAGHLLRDGILQQTLLNDWTNRLINLGNKNSLMMLIDLLVAGGAVLTNQNQSTLDQLAAKMKSATDKELLERYTILTDMVQSSVPPTEQIDRELRNPEMKHSPSIDKDLDGKYPTLFKRSDSIPLELSALADEDTGDENGIASIVTGYLYNSDPSYLSEATSKLESLNYRKNELRTAVDLLRAVVLQPADRQLVISELVTNMLFQGFYTEEMLKEAIVSVARENPNDIEHGKKLSLIYAQLIYREIVSYEDFETLFADMKGIWQYIIPPFFQECDRLLGTWTDELMDTDFWRQVRFVGDVKSIEEKLNKVHEMDIADFFPHYDLAYTFKEKSKNGNDGTDLIIAATQIQEKEELAKVIFEVILSFNDQQLETNAAKLKAYFSPVKKVFTELGEKFGERGKKLASLLQ